jgi:hypothetical protein
VALTEEQVSALDEVLDEFKAADYQAREEMVRDFFGSFKSTRTQGVSFDKATLKTVCAPSAALNISNKFPAYSAVSLWTNQAFGKKFRSRY